MVLKNRNVCRKSNVFFYSNNLKKKLLVNRMYVEADYFNQEKIKSFFQLPLSSKYFEYSPFSKFLA